MSKVTINGVTIEGDFAGRSIVVRNGVLSIDGSSIDLPDQKIINVEILGNVAGSIEASTGDIMVAGDTGNVRTTTGNITIGRTVSGDVETKTGDVRCGNVNGNVRTTTGNIRKN